MSWLVWSSWTILHESIHLSSAYLGHLYHSYQSGSSFQVFQITLLWWRHLRILHSQSESGSHHLLQGIFLWKLELRYGGRKTSPSHTLQMRVGSTHLDDWVVQVYWRFSFCCWGWNIPNREIFQSQWVLPCTLRWFCRLTPGLCWGLQLSGCELIRRTPRTVQRTLQ